ncbi:MAG: GNAT family N-acetyltransferase [Armatimonadota bacterium]|nr:GNAT family N-acetyltransferase [Armatimonadota bacterium]MDR7467243.1 GNAT family N-acetyltransferase [Armatimonadota bacterium]MDR7494829.1 GNAT family N-acetyltransferase [Armatimonadota bacterium]MDR7500278.1 GNAT family N-acetyltransferase [Armatimonadota bacterium]MDR7504529.1 GNAT family N-acetyltransferase [Armatimonadota bacterium]
MDDIVIRPLTALADLRAVEALQQEVWGMPDRDVVPTHHLLASVSAGGLVLGAFDTTGALIGFCYGFVGLREGRPLFYSHMAGVVRSWRGRGVGFRLKQAQREAALARGLERMVWTFDPLQAPNAHLNLHRLGACASRYYVDYYGEMPDALNRGLPSDRLEVDWWLRSERVRLLAGGRPPSGEVLDEEGALLRIEIPADFDALRRTDIEGVRRWRLRTREAFQRAFAAGYEAVDFVQGAYILRKKRAEVAG